MLVDAFKTTQSQFEFRGLVKRKVEPCENMKQLDTAKIISYGRRSHGMTEKLTTNTQCLMMQEGGADENKNKYK